MVSAAKLELTTLFEEALRIYQSGAWQEAAIAFQKLVNIYPDDGPSRFYREAAQARALGTDGQPPGSAVSIAKATPAHLA